MLRYIKYHVVATIVTWSHARALLCIWNNGNWKSVRFMFFGCDFTWPSKTETSFYFKFWWLSLISLKNKHFLYHSNAVHCAVLNKNIYTWSWCFWMNAQVFCLINFNFVGIRTTKSFRVKGNLRCKGSQSEVLWMKIILSWLKLYRVQAGNLTLEIS